MKISELNAYRCPKCALKLRVSKSNLGKKEIITGILTDDNGHKFFIKEGFPIFFNFKSMHPSDLKSKTEYDTSFKNYDDNLDFFYSTLGIKAETFDKSLVSLLDLKQHHKVLEVGAGTGEHTKFIAKKIGEKNTIYASDLSIYMLKRLSSKIKRKNISLSLINASALPFPNQMFDRVFHFGGLNNFGDVKKALKEMTRVTKVGGVVIVGDEGMAPWLKDTDFGKMLITSNPLFKNKIPIESIPENARDVMIKHVANGTFYIIKYTVGEGLPYLNSDIEFPGERGGTYVTRRLGSLEGITLNTKNLMKKAAKKSDKSFHRWLEDTIKERAEKELK